MSAAADSFSERGYHGTSIREVTQLAGVNLAAAHYHFGDKQGLYTEVLARALRTLNQARLAKLANAEELAGQHPIPLSLIIDIFARPLFELNEGTDSESRHVVRLIGRSMIEPLPFVDDLLAVELHPVTTRFAQAIRRHLPALTPEEFMWRLNFVIGALHHTLATMHRMKQLTRGICQDNDAQTVLHHFVQFASATLTQPK